MRNGTTYLMFTLLMISNVSVNAQCIDPTNIYAFEYDGHSYELVRENKTWTAASECAVSRFGYLAEINNEAEQDAIFDEVTNNAGITNSETENQFGTASIWIGGSDAVTEGEWIWDGDNDGIGPQFWSGGPDGDPIDGLYTNWGTSPAEPDNSGGQDHLTLIIKPAAVNFGLWNDLVSTNTIYYLIEYDYLVSVDEVELKRNIKIYPNPFKDLIRIENQNTVAIEGIKVFNLLGEEIKSIQPTEMIHNEIDLAGLADGMYILHINFENGNSISQKIMK